MNYQRGSSMEILFLLFKPVLQELTTEKQQHFKDNPFSPEDFICIESFTQPNLLVRKHIDRLLPSVLIILTY